ncbi:2-keto-3-deoxy-galactonokinase [Cellulophaga algicola DSM 14237]|uniref:2-keto-3-deoxy-galactonokinase n=1 Tax=Cellulophaga algicola (strain DSM 14237 / IC166 / ACAM 630) TaxID=688270 RepID=E6XA71_CELAD|nr:2-dehydro-3-deoxygalactonokinase [Cellulophaga algicola]ADV47761.1 2-keto-3-deoxy-galactonokinase [Cellulophaga algicola DSM 14237]
MKKREYFISCDWGTSNFRLRVVENSSLKILAEHKTDQGIKSLYEKYLTQTVKDQTTYFAEYLASEISNLPKIHRKHIVVAAGMASANIGLYEMDYADFPLNGNGDNLKWKHLKLPNNLELLLISGAKTNSEMMRGEEIQAVGLNDQLTPYQKGVLILPGTHSKHLTYRNSQYLDLKNFMTGELFEVLSQKSILSNSILKENTIINENVFIEGVKLGLKGLLSERLFSVRARHILDHKPKEDNYYFLSGLLIGDEIKYLANTVDTIFLVAPDPVFSLYKIALEQIIIKEKLILLDGHYLEKALLIGQQKILKNYDQ